MCQSSSRSPGERDLWHEHSLLAEIIVLHPDHLTSEELVVREAGGHGDTDRNAILDTLHALKRSGLVRFNGEVVEPTFATLRAAAIFQLP